MSLDPHDAHHQIEEGDDCIIDGCPGRYEWAYPPSHEGSCRCHISPPCSYCTGTPLICSECLEEAPEEPAVVRTVFQDITGAMGYIQPRTPGKPMILTPPPEEPVVTTIVYSAEGRAMLLSYPHSTKPMILTAKDLGIQDA